MFGVAAAYWGSAALLGLTGTMLAPVALGVGAAALALWGATKLAKGLGARIRPGPGEGVQASRID